MRESRNDGKGRQVVEAGALLSGMPPTLGVVRQHAEQRLASLARANFLVTDRTLPWLAGDIQQRLVEDGLRLVDQIDVVAASGWRQHELAPARENDLDPPVVLRRTQVVLVLSQQLDERVFRHRDHGQTSVCALLDSGRRGA